MSLHFRDAHLTVHVGDVRDCLRELPDASVNCVVTSPPYWGLRDYGEPGQIGLEPTPEEYVSAMADVFREVRRVLRDDGTVWLNLGDSYAGSGKGGGGSYDGERPGWTVRDNPNVPTGTKAKDLVGIPWRVAFALQADGWYLRSDIIWSKPNPMPESVTDRPTKAHEYVFLLTKSARYWYDADAVREPVTESSVRRLAAAVRNGEEYDPERHKKDARSSSPMDVMVRLARRSGLGAPVEQGSHQVGILGIWERAIDEPSADADAGDEAWPIGYPREAEVGADDKPIADGPRDPEVALSVVDGHEPSLGRNLRTVWTIPTQPYPGAHFATFPPKLVEPCVKAGCPEGGVVLDPFAGSGTTGFVANALGRRAVLIDLNPEYIDQAMQRNAQAPLGLEVSA